MANPLYWEDAVSSSGGKQTEMVVDTHAPAFTVQWGKGKYDDVVADHAALTGSARMHGSCEVCGRVTSLVLNVCAPCQRMANGEEHRRMQHDQAMGSHKRSSPVHLTRDGRITGQTKTPR